MWHNKKRTISTATNTDSKFWFSNCILAHYNLLILHSTVYTRNWKSISLDDQKIHRGIHCFIKEHYLPLQLKIGKHSHANYKQPNSCNKLKRSFFSLMLSLGTKFLLATMTPNPFLVCLPMPFLTSFNPSPLLL